MSLHKLPIQQPHKIAIRPHPKKTQVSFDLPPHLRTQHSHLSVPPRQPSIKLSTVPGHFHFSIRGKEAESVQYKRNFKTALQTRSFFRRSTMLTLSRQDIMLLRKDPIFSSRKDTCLPIRKRKNKQCQTMLDLTSSKELKKIRQTRHNLHTQSQNLQQSRHKKYRMVKMNAYFKEGRRTLPYHPQVMLVQREGRKKIGRE